MNDVRIIGHKRYDIGSIGPYIRYVWVYRRDWLRTLRTCGRIRWFLSDSHVFNNLGLLDDWLIGEEVAAQSPSFRIGREYWHVSCGLDRSLKGDDEWHFQQIGIWARYRRLKVGLSLGRNKLNRYPGYQSGIEVAGSLRFQYAKIERWIGYFTLTLSASWAKERK